jgi:hypothetical protein
MERAALAEDEEVRLERKKQHREDLQMLRAVMPYRRKANENSKMPWVLKKCKMEGLYWPAFALPFLYPPCPPLALYLAGDDISTSMYTIMVVASLVFVVAYTVLVCHEPKYVPIGAQNAHDLGALANQGSVDDGIRIRCGDGGDGNGVGASPDGGSWGLTNSGGSDGGGQQQRQQQQQQQHSIDINLGALPASCRAGDVHFCLSCNNFRPPRSKHCNDCGRCVHLHDHHCPWVNMCIGEGSALPFLVFAAALTIVNTINGSTIMVALYGRYGAWTLGKSGDRTWSGLFMLVRNG